MESEARSRPEAPPGPASRGRARSGFTLWWAGLLTGVLLCGSLTLVSPGGPGLVSIVSPLPGEVVGLAGVDVMARVPNDARVVPLSVRVLLNGADVTHLLTAGKNGAVGQLVGLLDGENVLRVEVEAASWWFDGRPYASGREVRFLSRRPLDLDRG